MADADDLAAFEAITENLEPVAADAGTGSAVTYSGTQISGFKDMLLTAELNRALADASFEHPSEVQHQCISPALIGRDILCQAKSGMGKTAVFVISTLYRLSQMDIKDNRPRVLVITHCHELAHQIVQEYQRFAKFMPQFRDRIAKVHGGRGRSRDVDIKELREKKPIIVVGCPGRIRDLALDPSKTGPQFNENKQPKVLDLSKIAMFVVDECDKLLDTVDSRADLTSIFLCTPRDKQVMMFTATLPPEIRTNAKRFMRDALNVLVDSESQLTLHGLSQFFMTCKEEDKATILTKLIDSNEHLNQTVIFVSQVGRATQLAKSMNDAGFPTLCLHAGMSSAERTDVYDRFKACGRRFIVATDVFARGVDVQAVTLVVNFDCPQDRFRKDGEQVLSGPDQYFHRVGRAGRFGTKGVALTLVSSEADKAVVQAVQTRFEVKIEEMTMENIHTLTDSLAAA